MGFEEIKQKTKPLADKVSFEIREKFMRLIKQQSKTIGEAMKECDLDLDTACAVLNQNIDCVSILSRETR